MVKFKKGKEYGRLKLIDDLGIVKGTRKFKCKCECGRVVSRRAYDVVNGHTESCGCLNKAIATQLAIDSRGRRRKSSKTELLYKRYKAGASRRGFDFELNLTQFQSIVKKNCFYCGIIPKSKLNGVDRVDNRQGYIINNCVPACKVCNHSKWIFSKGEFLDMVKRIYKHSIEGNQ